MTNRIQLIVGLGNPGNEYERTRHNAGAWVVEALARAHGETLRPSKYHGLHCKVHMAGQDVHLLFPTTYMNRSGQAVSALAGFFKIASEAILVAHDELDIAPGSVRLKQGGGHGGHNGLRDIISQLGNNRNFNRLRVGIGHPGTAQQVTGYVLGRAPGAEQQRIDDSIDEALACMPQILSGEWTAAMNRLHSFKAR